MLAGDEVALFYLEDEGITRETPSELNASITPRLPGDSKARIESAKRLAELVEITSKNRMLSIKED